VDGEGSAVGLGDGLDDGQAEALAWPVGHVEALKG